MITLGYCETCKGVTVFPLTREGAAETARLVSQFQNLQFGCGTVREQQLPAVTEKLARTCKKCGTNTAHVRHGPLWTIKGAFEFRMQLDEERKRDLESLRTGACEIAAAAEQIPGTASEVPSSVVMRYICPPANNLIRLRELLGAIEDIRLTEPPIDAPYYVKYGIRDYTLENE